MAPNQRSNVHSDAFQTDTNVWSGPLGRDTEVHLALRAAGRGLRLDHVQLAGPDRQHLPPGPRGAPEALRRADARGAGVDGAAAPSAQPEPVPGLRRRRLLLPRQPGPRGGPHDGAPRPRHRGEGRRVRRRAGLRPDRHDPERLEDHLGAARLVGPDLAGHDHGPGRRDRPRHRRGEDARPRRGGSELVRRRRQGRRLHRVGGRALPVQGGRERRAGGQVAQGLREHRRAEARAGQRGLRAPRRPSTATTGSRSPTTPTR